MKLVAMEDDIVSIFVLHKNGLTGVEIAKKYNVTTIGYFLKRKTWKHVKI